MRSPHVAQHSPQGSFMPVHPSASQNSGMAQSALAQRPLILHEVCHLTGDAVPPITLQPKMKIGAVGDRYEQEADRVAHQITRPIPSSTPNSGPINAQPAQHIQEQDEAQTEEPNTLQLKSLSPSSIQSGEGGIPVEPALEAAVQHARGQGRSLPTVIREPMEQAFNTNLSQVRVHADTQAHQFNQSLQSRAFTTGHDIFFRRGEYNPGSLQGQKLIAHELTHVMQQSGISHPDRIQRTLYAGAKSNLYETSAFTYSGANRERPTKATAFIHSHTVGQRGATPKAISLLHDPTDPAGMSDQLRGFDGGHIVGLSLGGDDKYYNIVPMYPGFNRGVWKNLETTIETDATYAYSGLNFEIVITLDYSSSPDERIPNSLSVIAKADSVNPKTKAKTRKQVKNYGTKTQPTDIPTTARLSLADEKKVTGNQSKSVVNATINKAAQTIQSDYNNALGAAYIKTNKHLPPSSATDYPDDPANRPYEYLDILTLADKIDAKTTFGSRRNFSAEQRKLILQTNMARNGGKIQSDDPNDPIYNPPHSATELSEQGAANFPEIDHIIPKSLGGSNQFSNARVVSWLLNNREDRVKNISGLVDVGRLALPVMPTSGTVSQRANAIVPVLMVKINRAVTHSELIQYISANYSSVTITKTWSDAIQSALDDMVAQGDATKGTNNKYKVV